MANSLLYRLFRIGGIPGTLRSPLEAEGIVVADEGIGGCYIAHDLSMPGTRSRRRREGFVGFLVLTRQRLVAYGYRRRQINIAVDDPKLSQLCIQLTGPQEIALSFETSAFHDDWRGVVELRFRTGKARRFYDTLIGIGLSEGVADGG